MGSMILVLVFAILVGLSSGNQVYIVGDNAGWTSIGHVDYNTWADTKTFRVGDTIQFVYNKDFHNVVRVTHHNYNSCNSTSPYKVYTSGNDTFSIKHSGHFYFICSYSGHCQAGQKVNIRVLHPTAPVPAPLPPQLQPPSSAPVPQPPQHQTPSPAPVSQPPRHQTPSSAPSLSPEGNAQPPKHSGGSALGDGKLWLIPAVLSALGTYGIA